MAPVICKSLKNKQSLLGLGWSLTSAASLVAFVTATILSSLTYSNYKNLASEYGYGVNQNAYYDNNNNSGDGEGGQSGDAGDEAELYHALGSVGSFSVIFAGLYTLLLSVALSCFGAMQVGFMLPTGKYVEPTVEGNPKFLGFFLGALVLFSNMLLVTAVVLGEFQVGNVLDDRQREEIGYFAIERTSSFLGTMSMFLAVLYFLYTILLFSMKDVFLPKNDEEEVRCYVAPMEEPIA